MAPFRVLVVDEESAARSALTELLIGAGHRVQEATTLRQALQRLAQGNIDVAVADPKLGGLHEREMVERVRREHPSLPLVLMSEHGPWGWGAREFPCVAAVSKPVDFEALVAAIDRAVACGGRPHRTSERPAASDPGSVSMRLSRAGEDDET